MYFSMNELFQIRDDHSVIRFCHNSKLQMINKEFDSVQFPGLTELLEESTYFNIFQDPQDKALLKALLHNSINEKVLTTNRYKFSASADFFVPNKTLYRDYVEFVKVNDQDVAF